MATRNTRKPTSLGCSQSNRLKQSPKKLNLPQMDLNPPQSVLNLPQMDPNPPHVRCNCNVFNTVWRVDGLRPGFCVLPDKPGGHALLTWGASLLTYYYLRAKPESQ